MLKSFYLVSALLFTVAISGCHRAKNSNQTANSMSLLLAELGYNDKDISLTFDDGPTPTFTTQILDILDQHHVKATFFEIGQRAERFPTITQDVLSRGHLLGSHSWNHPHLNQLPFDEAMDNIRHGHEAVETAAGNGFTTNIFRFPHFGSTPQLLRAITSIGLVAYPANIQPGDWYISDPDELLQKAISEVEKNRRGIVLFHDKEVTANMLDRFLTEVKARGYRIRDLR